jgi:hypothetical protein
VALDEMLTNIVDASLSQGNTKLANKCANRMHFAMPGALSHRVLMPAPLGLPVTGDRRQPANCGQWGT